MPELAKYPAKFIYEPWKAPLYVQQDCGCVIGKDYPARVVDHDIMVKENSNGNTDGRKGYDTHFLVKINLIEIFSNNLLCRIIRI